VIQSVRRGSPIASTMSKKRGVRFRLQNQLFSRTCRAIRDPLGAIRSSSERRPCITYPDLRSWVCQVRYRPGLVEGAGSSPAHPANGNPCCIVR